MLRATLTNARFAAIVAITLAFFATGIVAGAAGDSLIIGSEANNAGTANTQLLTNSNVVAFKLYQQGPGTALMGYTTPTTGATRGVYGRVDSPNGDGVQARNGAGSSGTGAALHAYGGMNTGAVIESDTKTPLVLVGPTGLAPMTVNSAVAVTNLNADLLDGLHANYLTRFAYNTDDNNALVGANGTVISTTITAPTRGWLHITASSDVLGSAASATVCNLDVDGTNIASSFRVMAFDGASLEEDCSTNAGYFTCGGTHTVRLEASFVAATTTYDEATIEVTFYPYGGDGSRPSIIPCISLTPEAGWTIDN